jgi:hypothetical protein
MAVPAPADQVTWDPVETLPRERLARVQASSGTHGKPSSRSTDSGSVVQRLQRLSEGGLEVVQPAGGLEQGGTAGDRVQDGGGCRVGLAPCDILARSS